MHRRAVLLGGLAIAAGAAGCVANRPGGPPDAGAPTSGEHPSRLAARPPAGRLGATDPQPGVHVLDLGPTVLLRVPSGMADGTPGRLVLTLHGAGGDAHAGLAPLAPLADAYRLLLLAPTSHGKTWDVLTGGWGPDVRRIDEALEETFASYPVQGEPVAISGFSDGASYALSLGLANADLFTDVLAFSPGFVAPVHPAGALHVYISHGRADEVLPIDRTTRRIVPQLRSAGIPVEVHEFDGGHAVPPEIAADAVRSMLG